MVKKIREIVADNTTLEGKLFDLIVQLLVIFSLVSFTVETMPDLSEDTYDLLNLIELVTIILFTIEYLLRILVAQKMTKFIFSFYGLVDLLAILPFYLTTGLDLRSIRAFRLLRLFRLLKLVRYNRALRRFKYAFIIAKEELFLYIFVTLLLVYFSSVGIYYFETESQPEVFKSVFHSMWWAVATLTTVGYGDVYPVTTGGKIFTFIILMLGLGIVAAPAGIISSALSKAREIDEENNRDL